MESSETDDSVQLKWQLMSHKRFSQLNFPSKVHFPSKALSSSFQIEIMTYFSLQVEENATFFFGQKPMLTNFF